MAATLDLGNLLVHLMADSSQYKKIIRDAERQMQKTADKMTQIGRQMSMRVTLPIAAVGAASVKAFASFDDAMTKSLAIMSGITPQLRQEMESLALEISVNGVTSAKDLAKSYFYLASAGLDAEQSMASLGAVEKFAVAGAFDMATATDLATDAQSALGLTVKNAQQNLINMTRVTDVLTGANTLANATTQQFSLALTSQAGPAMKAYGIQLEEGVAVLAAYADQGIKAQNAGNMFSRMLRLMTKGFIDNRAEWERFNINIFDAVGNLKPLHMIIGDLTRAMANMSTEQKIITLQMLGFQARSQQAILPLLGLQNRIKGYNEALLKMGGITKRIAEEQMKSFSSQMKILKNHIVAAGIGIGDMLAPSILRLNEHVKNAIDYWNLLETSIKRNILMFAGIAAAIGPILLLTGLLIKSLLFMISTVKILTASFVGLSTTMFGPVGIALLLVGIAYTLRAAWIQNLEIIKNRTQEWFDAFKEGFNWLGGTMLADMLVYWVESFQTTFSYIKNNFGEFLTDIAGMWYGTIAWLKKMKEGVVQAWDAPTFNQMINEFKRGFEEAGNAWAFSFLGGSERAEKALEDFKASLKQGVETTGIYLKAFGIATVDHLQELMDAVKAQFGADADALIELIKSKMLKLKIPLGITPEDVAEVEGELNKLINQFKKLNEEVKDPTPLEQWMGNALDVTNRISEAFANAFQRMGNELATFLIEGQANFREFARAVLKDLLAIIIRAQMVRALTSFFPGLIPTPAPTPQPVYNVPSPVGHMGGIVGQMTAHRMVPATTFIGAPRLHTGLAADEFPTILQRGETVIPKGKGLVPPTVIINNNTGQPMRQEGTPQFNGREWVVGIVTEEINQYGSLRHSIQAIGQGQNG